MKIFLTGGTGFLGSRIVGLLRERGDDVVALARKNRGATLLAQGCELVHGDLTEAGALFGIDGCDAVIHAAARYEVGLPKSQRLPMMDVNVGGTRRILDAAIEAGVPRIVHVSSVTVLGNTREHVVDETHTRLSGPLSIYDESKSLAHQVAINRIEKGAPILLAMPGVIYGPHDHAEVGRQLLAASRGQLRALMLTDGGFSLVHVDDVAKGIVQVLDGGEVGQSYLLAGENLRFEDALQKAAELGGSALPKRRIATSTLRRLVPIAPWVLPSMGYPPNLGELIQAADRVTYWASSEKAQQALGYTYRDFATGFAEVLEATKE